MGERRERQEPPVAFFPRSKAFFRARACLQDARFFRKSPPRRAREQADKESPPRERKAAGERIAPELVAYCPRNDYDKPA